MNQKYFLSVVFWQKGSPAGYADVAFSPPDDYETSDVLKEGKNVFLKAYCDERGVSPSSIIVQAIAFNPC